MIKIENYEVTGWEHAIRGMRNPLESWEKSDSNYTIVDVNEIEDSPYIYMDPDEDVSLVIGPNDQKLMKRLRNAGTDHRKFMRMIVVYVDITAPLYWWKEFDTYKVGTVANSCSTMHTIHKRCFTFDDFSYDHLLEDEKVVIASDGYELSSVGLLGDIISMLNSYRDLYLQTKDKQYWWQMIQLLPSSYNQKRTVMLNYEVLANMHKSRKNHRLNEWREFCEWMKELPYSELITGDER